ncbi:MAG: DUF554 family protein [Verrucomicrobiota bacterium]
MIGAFLNALGILLGALAALGWRKPFSARTQNFAKSALGALTVFFGLRLVWQSIGGPAKTVLWQLFLALLAVFLGHLLGRLLQLQKMSNWLGRRASERLAAAQKNPPGKPMEGFTAATVLFCAAPLGILGAVTDGLTGYYHPLALKAVMDGLAMAGFVSLFRWPVALAALPVFIFLTAIATAVNLFALPGLAGHHLVEPINAAAGLVMCAISLVILSGRRVELANYLPALMVAPVLAWFIG